MEFQNHPNTVGTITDRRGSIPRWGLNIMKRNRTQYRHEYYLKHKTLEIQRSKEWELAHPEQTRENKKKHSLTKRGKETKKKWTLKYKSSSKYKEKIRRDWNKRHRLLGFIPLNQPFDDSEAHHIDRTYVIYIPKTLHHSIPHNVFTGYNMDILEDKILEWFLQSPLV